MRYPYYYPTGFQMPPPARKSNIWKILSLLGLLAVIGLAIALTVVLVKDDDECTTTTTVAGATTTTTSAADNRLHKKNYILLLLMILMVGCGNPFHNQ
ncbi:hypothetical protein SNEBB_001396 [Seison nebaliae]|nr:hypothetical protein SNEBB_001396 [Seison nebaliae]